MTRLSHSNDRSWDSQLISITDDYWELIHMITYSYWL